jgi:hypothetical protein
VVHWGGQLKDPNGVKVYALNKHTANRNKKGESIIKDRRDDSPPGTNTGNEVRAAQRNLLACAIGRNMVGVISTPDGKKPYRLNYEGYDHETDDIMDMITPNTAYVSEVETRFEHTRALPSKDSKKDARYKKHRQELGYEE